MYENPLKQFIKAHNQSLFGAFTPVQLELKPKKYQKNKTGTEATSAQSRKTFSASHIAETHEHGPTNPTPEPRVDYEEAWSLLCAIVGGDDLMDADASRARPTGEH